MAFRKKADKIFQLFPDIAIIPECEHPGNLNFDSRFLNPNTIIWHGNNKHKGLGVFSFNGYTIKLLDTHNQHIKTVLPIRVSNKREKYLLLAVWAHNPHDPAYRYIGQVWKAIEAYENLFEHEQVIIAGDFNSNVIWDKLKRKISHTMVVEKLQNIGIVSSYHLNTKYKQGQEKHPTFFLYRHENKPYHIDYCFVSKRLASKIKSVEIGGYSDWVKYSDHSPLIVDFETK